MTWHYETGHASDGPGRKDAWRCSCTIGVDHSRYGELANPPTILGEPAATCSACGALREPPRLARRRRS